MAGLEPTTVNRAQKPDLIPGYRLEALLGRGGMGEVYKATQLSLNRTVAVKLLSPELAKDSSFVARFEKEAAALATLSHPNVVDIVDKGRAQNTWYLVMEFIDGASLREVMRSPLLDPTASLRMVLEICRGVEYAHSRGVIHRDLKPENILFDEQAGGLAKVTDFGLASFLEGPNEAKFNVTETHVAMGTASYMAPEQRVDARGADHRADIYSLGVILYEALTGELPMGAFDPPSVRKPGVDPRVDAIVARCLKQDPKERYAKTSELVADLELLVPVSKTAVGRAPTRVGKVVRSVGRAVRAAVRLGVVLLVLAAAGVLGLSWLRSEEPPEEPWAGAAVTADLEARDLFPSPGRLDKEGPRRRFTLGKGPDTIPLLAFGRPVSEHKGALVSAPVPGARAARLTPDIVDLEGDEVALQARVSATPREQGLDVWLRRLLFARPPKSSATVLLSGSTGRYASVSISSAGAPVAFEWALGERRGVMLGPPSPDSGEALLELAVDDDGVVRAFLGEGKDRRQVAEPLYLGKGWKKHFGDEVKPSLGCFEGTCRFEAVSYRVSQKPPPPPPAPIQTAVVPVPPAKVVTKAPAKAVARPAVAPAKARPTTRPANTPKKKSTTTKGR